MGPSLDQAIQQFLDHLRVERELTPATVEAYGRDLSRFAHFAAGRTVATADAVRSIDILDFLVHLTEKKLSARSQARRLIALRQLFKFLKAERIAPVDPTEDVDLPRFGRKLPDYPDGRRDRPPAGRARSPHAARRARRRDAGAAVRDGPARVGAGQDAAARRQLRRRLPDHVRQGRARSAWSPSARRRWRRCAPTSRRRAAPACAARRWTRCSSPHHGRAMTRQGFWKLLGRYAVAAGIRKRDLAAQAAALVRHPPGRARRRPARRAGDARPRRHRHDRDLHARLARPPPLRLRPLPPPRLSGGTLPVPPQVRPQLPAPARHVVDDGPVLAPDGAALVAAHAATRAARAAPARARRARVASPRPQLRAQQRQRRDPVVLLRARRLAANLQAGRAVRRAAPSIRSCCASARPGPCPSRSTSRGRRRECGPRPRSARATPRR